MSPTRQRASVLRLLAIASLGISAIASTAAPISARTAHNAAVAPADVKFMQGMIHHHAQAVLMAGWAASHGASQKVRELCEKIVVSQRDEILMMQNWLRDHGAEAPVPNAEHDVMPGMETNMMPGMLNARQLAQLDSARGIEFDRLFLSYMIMHHRGAITMVEQLFGTNGAAQDGVIFRFASDVNSDQTVEIATMSKMLAARLPKTTAAPSPSTDPRVGLKPGWFDAGEASWNMRLVSTTPPAEVFIDRQRPGVLDYAQSDIAFTGHYVIQGNFRGFTVFDVANPAKPAIKLAQVCVGSQSDVSVVGHLLFESEESTNSRIDCGTQGVADTVSAERFRGVRIWDISDIAHPKPVAQVQTCRGSHTHSVVTSPADKANVYVYVSGQAPVRSDKELPKCSGLMPEQDPNSELFRIEVIQVPLAHPEQAHVVSKPPILANLPAPAKHPELAADMAEIEAHMKALGITLPPAPANPTGPVQCHDITVYPAEGIAGGACAGYGVLLDIRDPSNPKRIFAAADSNFAFWHSATFNNDGTKVLFTDEWGGGTQPRCRATDNPKWGADAIFSRDGDKLVFEGYYKLPAPQTNTENCVAHNGSLVPVPGRDIMVQGWYQGGVSVFDFTDAAHPKEIAFFDRGPMDPEKLETAGSWSAYWYNGLIYSSEIARGLDILALQPGPLLSQNEIDAAKLVRFDELNVQNQPKLTWPASFVVARAYIDQLERSQALPADRIAGLRKHLGEAEATKGAERRHHLGGVESQLGDPAKSGDAKKVRLLKEVIQRLSTSQ